jgi:hypothetical protein
LVTLDEVNRRRWVFGLGALVAAFIKSKRGISVTLKGL